MELSEMKLADLLKRYDGFLESAFVSADRDRPHQVWCDPFVQEHRAELKKRCDEPACPCPEYRGEKLHWVGERVVEKVELAVTCPKCGCQKHQEFRRDIPPRVDAVSPCTICFASRSPAPKGYEHVNEWRLPANADEPWLNYCGTEVCQGFDAVFPVREHNGGKRWILRHVEEVVCCKCRKPIGVQTGLQEKLGIATVPCADCQLSRPRTQPGYEHVGEWRPPKANEHYLGDGGCSHTCQMERASLGSRWILRKVEEEAKPITTEDNAVGLKALVIALEAASHLIHRLTRRVEKLEQEAS